MSFTEVMHAGTRIELDELNTRSQHLQFDDPINIQFTSVSSSFNVLIRWPTLTFVFLNTIGILKCIYRLWVFCLTVKRSKSFCHFAVFDFDQWRP